MDIKRPVYSDFFTGVRIGKFVWEEMERVGSTKRDSRLTEKEIFEKYGTTCLWEGKCCLVITDCFEAFLPV